MFLFMPAAQKAAKLSQTFYRKCCQKREGQKLHLWSAEGGPVKRRQPKELVLMFPSKAAAAEGERSWSQEREDGRRHGGEQVGETQGWRWSREVVGGGANEGETVKKGTGVRLEGETIVLLTWPVQLPLRRLISPEVSSGNYHIVSRTRGYARRPRTHVCYKQTRTCKHVAMDTCNTFWPCWNKEERW